MNRDVTVVISTIPKRRNLLNRALESVYNQTVLPAAISIAIDTNRDGGAVTRSRAMSAVQTTWLAHLDDDDEFKPNHLERCLEHAEYSGADIIVPWFQVIGGTDPFPHNRGLVPNAEGKIRNKDGLFPVFGICCLVKTEAAKSLDFVPWKDRPQGYDHPYWLSLEENGYRVEMIPDITWLWHHDSGNTSGRSDKW